MTNSILFLCRSTPQPDKFYGGQEDLSAAVGYEENGITTIAFRKPLKSIFEQFLVEYIFY